MNKQAKFGFALTALLLSAAALAYPIDEKETNSSVVTSERLSAFVWPAAWSDAKPGEAKYGGMFRDYSYIDQTFNTFTDDQWMLGGFPEQRRGPAAP